MRSCLTVSGLALFLGLPAVAGAQAAAPAPAAAPMPSGTSAPIAAPAPSAGSSATSPTSPAIAPPGGSGGAGRGGGRSAAAPGGPAPGGLPATMSPAAGATSSPAAVAPGQGLGPSAAGSPVPAAAADAGGGLPAVLQLDDAVNLFRSRGFDLLLADAAVQSARGDEQLAGAVPNPVVSGAFLKAFAYDVGVPGDPGQSDLGFSVGLTDTAVSDVVSGKRGLRLRVARAALAAARLSRADAQRTIEFQVKQTFVLAAQLGMSLDFAREVQQAATQTMELNKLRFKAGAISEAELAKTETAKLIADQTTDQLTGQARLAHVELAYLIGERGSVPDYRVSTELLERKTPVLPVSSSREELLRLAFEHRPDLRGLQAQLDRAEASRSLARRLNVPDFQIQAGYTQQGTGNYAIQPPTLTVGAAVTLPLFYQRQGERQRADADLRAQRVSRDKTAARVRADVESAYVASTVTVRLLQRMEGLLLDRARRARDLGQIQYQKGAASLLEYLDAQRTYISTNLDYLQQRANYWTALFQLEQAVGTELNR